jgi:hypothetical protein
MARSYIENRAEKVARMFGRPYEFIVNDSDPYRCITGVSIPQVQSLISQAARLVQTMSHPADSSPVEYMLRQIVAPEQHARLHDEFVCNDPKLVIMLGDEDVADIVRDFIAYLAGGLPFESSEPSADGSSITGTSSEPPALHLAAVQIH